MTTVIVAENGRLDGRRRPVAITLTMVLGVLCLASLVLAAVVRQSPIFIPIQLGQSEIVVEIDRSPSCPNGMLGMCAKGGTGLTYLSVWRYTRPTPTSQTAQPLFAVPIAP